MDLEKMSAPAPGTSGSTATPLVGSRRLLLVIAMCACNFISFADRTIVGICIIGMQAQYGWSSSTKGAVMGAFYYGYTLTQIPCGRAAERLGCKRVLNAAVLLWSLATVATPFMASQSLNHLLLTRAVLGMAEGAHFPVMALYLALWFPPSERGRALGIAFLGIEAGTITALVCAPWIVSHLGWQSNFHVFGSLGLLWFAWSELHLAAHPHQDPHISAAELEHISTSTAAAKGHTRSTAAGGGGGAGPGLNHHALVQSPSFWAIVGAHCGFMFPMHLLALWLPTYFHRHLRVAVPSLPWYTVMPQVVNAASAVVGGWWSDREVARGRPLLHIRRVGASVGFLVPAALLQAVWLVRTPGWGALLFCGIIGCIGVAPKCGHMMHLMDVAPGHVGTIMGIANTLGSVMGLASNMFAGWFLDVTNDSWEALCSLLGLSLLAGWIVFMALARPGQIANL